MGRNDGSAQSFSTADEPAANTISFIHKLAASDAFKSLFREGMTPGRRSGRLSRRPRPRGIAAIAAPGRLGLCDREHAADDAADAGRLLAAAPARGQRGRDDHGAGLVREAQGPARRAEHRLRRRSVRSSCPPALRQFSLKSLRLQARVAHLDRVDGGRERPRAGAAAQRGGHSGRAAAGGLRALSAPRFGAPRRRDSASPWGCAAALLAALVGKSSLRTEI